MPIFHKQTKVGDRLTAELSVQRTEGRPTLSLHASEIKARGGGTPYNGLYGEAQPERVTLFGLQVYKRVGISQGLGI